MQANSPGRCSTIAAESRVIAFFDTSALVKLYIDEAHSEATRRLLAEIRIAAVCRIAWAEAHAAFSRRARERPEDRAALDLARRQLTEDWPHFLVVDATQAVVARAADYADLFALRAYDSVQLAAAHETLIGSGEAVQFACFDHRLNKAAAVLGLGAPFATIS